MGIDRPADYDDFKAEVLADQEADEQGVYEVWWSANSRYPGLSLSARLAIAESVVGELLRAGRISLVQGKWIGPGPGSRGHRRPGSGATFLVYVGATVG